MIVYLSVVIIDTTTTRREKVHMEKKNDQKAKPATSKLAIVVLLLILALCIVGIVTTVMGQKKVMPMAREALIYIGYILVLAYAFAGYRVPHGNMLKYTILLFAVLMMVTVMSKPSISNGSGMNGPGQAKPAMEASENPQQQPAGQPAGQPAPQPAKDAADPLKKESLTPDQETRSNLFELGFVGAIIILISYMAGRLDRIRENQIIIIIVLVLFILRAILANYGGQFLHTGFNECNMWLVLSVSYLCRYRQHREAGLVDRKHAKN